MNQLIKMPRWPYSDETEEKVVCEVLRTDSWWRNAGTQVKLFENEFAEYHECNGGVSVANGTVAIEIALKALNIGKGDEVILPTFTFYSTVSAILAVGAIPVLIDVSDDTFCLNPDLIQDAISDKTKAIIVVHMAGNITDMDAVNRIALENNLYVIEDAAHAHGAAYKGKKAGSLSTCGTFSFQNAKLLTAGEGGMILSNNQEFLKNAFFQSNCGRAEGDTTYQHVLIGTNARLSEVQGAILRVQLSRLDKQQKLREKNYQILSNLLENIEGIRLQSVNQDVTINSHYMVMFYYSKEYFREKSRAEFVQYLKDNGIASNRAFEAIHRLPVFDTLSIDAWRMVGRKDEDGNIHCLNSENIADHVVCLNHNILLGDEELMKNIAQIIKDFQ